jgi:hypothetical protein
VKGQAALILLFFSTVAGIACAQLPSERPFPEVPTLVRQAILQQRILESKEQEYVFREDVHENKLRRECTWAPHCPSICGLRGVKCVAYIVLGSQDRNFEIFWLDGTRVARVLPHCDSCSMSAATRGDWTLDIHVSDSDLAAENQRVAAEVAEAKALSIAGKDPSSKDDPPQILLSRMFELCTFSNPRREVVNGRSTILLDFAWNPAERATSANQALLKSLVGTVGIDEEDHAVQRVEGRFTANVNAGDGNVSIRKGTRVTLTNARVDPGTWLLSELLLWGEAHYFAFDLNGQGLVNAGHYQQFRSTLKILPNFTEIPTAPAKPAPPKPTSPVDLR